jgi:cohesin complex subunit SCC1
MAAGLQPFVHWLIYLDAILTQDEGPTTLRLSGQLMLGVTRIYSRKVQYLLDDCKETKDRISLVSHHGVMA